MTTDRIEKSIELKAPIERVWRALTDQKEFSAWFGAKLDNAFVVGQTTTGIVNCSGHKDLTWAAAIKKIEAPYLFSLTWHPYAIDVNVDYSQEPSTLVEFRLKSIPGGTHLTVVESGFDALPAHRKTEAFRSNENGWAIQIRNIQAYVEQP